MERKYTKRQYLQRMGGVVGGLGTVALAGCTGDGGSGAGNSSEPTEDGGSGAGDLSELDVLIPEGDMAIPFYLSSEVQDRFQEQDISISPKVVSYDRSSRALTSGPSQINDVAPAEWINAINNGEDIPLVGGNLIQVNSIFTLPDSDIEGPADLEGATLGVPFNDSGTTLSVGAMLQDGYDIDIREDLETQSAAPATLWNQMVENQGLDAILLWTGYTIKGLAQDDTVQEIMNAQDYWREKTGVPPMIKNFGARREWLDESPGEALAYVEAWNDGMEYAIEGGNTGEIVKQYGRLAGLTTEAEKEVVIELIENERLMLHPQSKWDSELLDGQWELFNLMAETGFIDESPPRELGISHSELTDMA